MIKYLLLKWIGVDIELCDCAHKLLSVDEDVLLLLEHVGQVVEDEKYPLVPVCSHQDVRFLEVFLLK